MRTEVNRIEQGQGNAEEMIGVDRWERWAIRAESAMKSARIQARANYQQRKLAVNIHAYTGNGGWFDWANSRQFLAIADFIELALKSAWLSATPTVDQQRHGSLPRGSEGTARISRSRSIGQRANLLFAVSRGTDFFHFAGSSRRVRVEISRGFRSAFC